MFYFSWFHFWFFLVYDIMMPRAFLWFPVIKQDPRERLHNCMTISMLVYRLSCLALLQTFWCFVIAQIIPRGFIHWKITGCLCLKEFWLCNLARLLLHDKKVFIGYQNCFNCVICKLKEGLINHCEILYFMFSMFVIINQFSFVYCIRENRRNKLHIDIRYS